MPVLLCSLLLALSPPASVDSVEAVDSVDSVDAVEAVDSVDAEPSVEVVHLESRVAASTGGASNLKGRFRIHLDGNLFTFQHRREWFENDHMPIDDIEDVDNSVGVGIGQYNFGLGLGYGITDGLVVGAKFGLGFNATTRLDRNPLAGGPDPVNNTLTFLFRPYVEYAFIPGGRFRPFVFVHGGVAGGHFVQTDTDGNDAIISNSVSPTLGGGGGLHIFVIPQLSIDLFGELDHYFVLAKTKFKVDGDIDPNLGDADFNRQAMQTEFSVLAGLSLWFGGA